MKKAEVSDELQRVREELQASRLENDTLREQHSREMIAERSRAAYAMEWYQKANAQCHSLAECLW